MADHDFDDDLDDLAEPMESDESLMMRQMENEDDDEDDDSMGEPEQDEEQERRSKRAGVPAAAPAAAAPSAVSVRRSASTKSIGAAPSSSRAAAAALGNPTAATPVAAAAAAAPPARSSSSSSKPPSSGSVRAGSTKKSSLATPRSGGAAPATTLGDMGTARGVSPPPVQVHATVPDSKRRGSFSAAAKPAASTTAALSRPKLGAPVVAKARKPAPTAAAASPAPLSDDDDAPPPASVRRTSVAPSSAAARTAAKKAAAAAAVSDGLSPSSSSPASFSSSSLAAAGYDFDAHATLSSLQDSNRALTMQLAARDSENAQLAEALLTLQEELQSVEASSGSNLAKDLARKNRDAGLLLAKERARFEKTIEAMKKEHARALEEAAAGGGGGGATSGSRGPASPKRAAASSFAFGSTIGSSAGLPALPAGGSDEPQVHQLETRLRDSLAAQAHLQKQYLDKCTELSVAKSHSQKLARALMREIDDAAVKSEAILDESFLGKFKGRAQKITLLQSKVRDLEKSLAASQSQGHHAPYSTTAANDFGGSVGSGGGHSDRSAPSTAATATATVQDLNEHTLAKMASEKRSEIFTLRELLETRNTELDTLRKRSEAGRARRTVLENEVKALKDTARTLFDKSAQDDALIDSLRRALEKAQKDLSAAPAGAGAAAASASSSSGRRPASGSGAAAAAAVRNNYDSTKLAEQEKLIVSLREQLRKAQSVAVASSPALAGSLRAYANAEADTQLALLRVEHEKLRELLGHHGARIADLEAQLLQAQKQNVELRAAASVAAAAAAPAPAGKHRAGTTTLNSGAARSTASSRATGASSSSASAAPGSGPGPAPSAASVSALQSQLQCALSEADLIRTSYANTLANKEQDIAILNDILNQKNQLYQQNIADMRHKFAQITAALQ